MTPESTLTVSQVQAQTKVQELDPIQAGLIQHATEGLAEILAELLANDSKTTGSSRPDSIRTLSTSIQTIP